MFKLSVKRALSVSGLIVLAAVAYSICVVYLWGKVENIKAGNEPEDKSVLIVEQRAELESKNQEVIPSLDLRETKELQARSVRTESEMLKGLRGSQSDPLNQELIVRASRYISGGKFDKNIHGALLDELIKKSRSDRTSEDENIILAALIQGLNEIGISQLNLEVSKLHKNERDRLLLEFLVRTPELSLAQRERILKMGSAALDKRR